MTIAFLNGHVVRHRCDRNLYVRRVTFRYRRARRRPSSAGNPFDRARGYVDPHSAAARAARGADPTTRALLDKIAVHPQADWFGDWNPTATVATTVRDRIRQEVAAGALPVLVLYAIPDRDCSGFSAGGLADATAYAKWINQVADGIGAARTVTILEPDALALMDCLSGTQQAARERMLAAAVTRLDRQPDVAVYLDAGHEAWQPASVIAARLRAANAASARGFTLNVSNFYPTAGEEAYGDRIVSALGGAAHFLVDTSRNGQGSNGQWCNPDGRGLGLPWTTRTGDRLADALLWVKHPGESDGTCNGGPAAGAFWAPYAAALASRAAF